LIKPAAEDKRRELISRRTNYFGLHRVLCSLGFPQLYHITWVVCKSKRSFFFAWQRLLK